jgi:3'-5' exoribonuclease
VPEAEVPPEVRKVINRDRKPQILAAKRILEDPSPWREAKLHSMLMQFADENLKRFFNAPAATGNHHAWRGGLLVHTAEVASNCLSILESPMNQFYREDLDSDVLLLAAWFHDTGKMETYRMEGENPVLDAELEQKIGHPTISNLIFSDFARRNGLGGYFSRLVSHCILSHHGKRAWGAVVRPRTTEAKILCRADYISSRMPD